MRILHLIPTLKKGGAERLCLDTVSALSSINNVQVKLAILRNENEYQSEYPTIQPIHVNSSVSPSLKGKWTVNTREWEALLEEFKPDIVHSHLFEAEMLSRYQIRPGIKYFSHCHDNMPVFEKPGAHSLFNKQKLTRAYERRFILRQYEKANNRFLAISPDTLAYFKNNLGKALQNNIELFPNAINTIRFAHPERKAFSGGTLKIINIGAFIPVKNQQLAIKILKELKMAGVQAELTFVGEGTEMAGVKKLAEQEGLSNQVHFAGKQSEVSKYLADSHLYLHTGIKEAFGLVLLEAMASGLPVVSLNGHGNKELVENGKNGFLIEKQDPEAFLKAIKTITENEETYLQYSQNAVSFARQYDINAYVQKLMDLYTNSLKS